MDYKYIEQLVERYFDGDTTLQEEHILHSFFSQEEVPQELEAYQPLLASQEPETLGDDFDARILALTEEGGLQPVRAKQVRLGQRLMPLFRAAAVVAIILTLGNAMRFSMNQTPQQADDINYADYTDTYDDPSVAYGQVENALMLISEGYSQASPSADSIVIASATGEDSMITQ